MHSNLSVISQLKGTQIHAWVRQTSSKCLESKNIELLLLLITLELTDAKYKPSAGVIRTFVPSRLGVSCLCEASGLTPLMVFCRLSRWFGIQYNNITIKILIIFGAFTEEANRVIRWTKISRNKCSLAAFGEKVQLCCFTFL